MPRICVSGPVVRHSAQWDLVPWVQEIYRLLEAGGSTRHAVQLPQAEPALEKMKPLDLVHAMRQRIAGASALITVFTPGDVSAAVETTMASVAGKKIVLIAEAPEEIPRLLRGLPGVVAAVPAEDFSNRFESTMARLGVEVG